MTPRMLIVVIAFIASPLICSAQTTRVIHGMAVDENGRRVAGAVIQLVTPGMMPGEEVTVYGKVESDEFGQFRAEVPERWFEQPITYRQELGILGSHRVAGYGAIGISRYAEFPLSPLTVVLQPPRDKVVTVVGPDKTPIADAEVSAAGLLVPPFNLEEAARQGQREENVIPIKGLKIPARAFIAVPLPPDWRKELTRRTNRLGTATLGVPQEAIGTVQVQTDALGVQIFNAVVSRRRPEGTTFDNWSNRLQLAPVTKLRGSLQSSNGEDAAGVDVFLTTYVSDKVPFVMPFGSARVTTGADGKFEATIASGRLNLQVSSKTRPDFRATLPPPGQLLLKPGARELRLPWQKGIRVRGLVRDVDSKEPLAKVSVGVYSGSQLSPTMTDDDGRFEVYASPGQAGVMVNAADQFLPEDQSVLRSRLLVLKPDDDVVDVPTIELRRWGSVGGRVINDDGKPVPGAEVSAVWTGVGRTSRIKTYLQRSVTTDDDGAFEFQWIDPDSTLSVIASSGKASSEAAQQIPAKTADAEIMIAREHLLELNGRIVDGTGNAMAGLELILQRRAILPNSADSPADRVELERPLVTDKDGRFRTEKRVPRGWAYRAVARAGTDREATSVWIEVTPEKTAFPNFVVNRLASLSGRVVDTAGRPVHDALVRHLDSESSTEVRTGPDGRFSFGKSTTLGGFILVEAEGCRFTGALVTEAGKAIRMQVRRLDETEPKRGPIKPLLPPPGRRRAIATELLEPFFESDDRTRRQVLMTLAEFDPDRTLELVEAKPFAASFFNDMIRRAVVKGLIIAGRNDDAFEIAGSLSDPGFRAQALQVAYDLVPDLTRARKLELLAEGLVLGRQVKTPEHRIHAFGAVGERLLDLGEREQAERVLREGQRIAEQLSNAAFAGYSKGAFAEELAQIDVKAALKLCEKLTDVHEFNRHHGNMAHELATIDPGEAERILDLLKPRERQVYPARDGFAERVCYRMVRVDPDRAERIAGRISFLTLRAETYGLMAHALFEANPQANRERAVELLQKAISPLRKAASLDQKKPYIWNFPAGAAAELSLLARGIDPGLEHEFAWRAISFLQPVETEGQWMFVRQEAPAQVALLLASRFPNEARAILNWLPAWTGSPSLRCQLPALVRLDPETAINAVKQLDNGPQGLRARVTLVQFLTADGTILDRHIDRSMMRWTPDDEDHGQ